MADVMQNQYDLLWNRIENTYKKININEIDCKRILVISMSEESRFHGILRALEKQNKEIEFIFIVQPSIRPMIETNYPNHGRLVDWSGPYTTELVKLVDEKIGLNSIDGFLFFSEQVINMRDINFYEIGTKIQDNLKIGNNCRFFSSTIGEEYYEYTDIYAFLKGIKLNIEYCRLLDNIQDFIYEN